MRVKHVVTRVGKVAGGSEVLLKVALIPAGEVCTSASNYPPSVVKAKSRKLRRYISFKKKRREKREKKKRKKETSTHGGDQGFFVCVRDSTTRTLAVIFLVCDS